MMKIPEFEGLFDMHSEYLLPGIFMDILFIKFVFYFVI